MPSRHLIVVGGSAGSLAPLMSVVEGLPSSFPGTVLVVVHGSSEGPGNLARILERVSRVPVATATHGQRLDRGVFVAPPNHHLLVMRGRLLVTTGPKENGFRPSIDVLFRTAAHSYGPKVIGVVLSGALDDGAAGLFEIKTMGGLAIVQDPEDATVSALPRTTIALVDVDFVVPASAIAPLLCRENVLPPGDVAMSDQPADPQLPGEKTNIAQMNDSLGAPSALTCPDCGGALWQIEEGRLTRYQCHVGHRYSSESLVTLHDGVVEAALWTAVRTLEERADLRRRMARQTQAAGLATVSESFDEQAAAAEEQANQVRNLLTRPGGQAEAFESQSEDVPALRKRPRQG